MLNERATASGVTYFTSSLLSGAGVVHAFSTRKGGVSGGCYESLNLGLTMYPHGDTEGNIAENFRRFERSVGLADRVRAEVYQVHGRAVWIPRCGEAGSVPEADAMITDQPDQYLAIRTADCCPVLLASPAGDVVGAVHAGWRGIVAGVVTETVRCFQSQFGVPADQLVAAIGPSIGPAHYEVGSEVSSAFHHAGMQNAIKVARGGKSCIDLKYAVQIQLHQCNLKESRIDCCECCTYRSETEFFSYRRDNKRTGMMVNVIAVTG